MGIEARSDGVRRARAAMDREGAAAPARADAARRSGITRAGEARAARAASGARAATWTDRDARQRPRSEVAMGIVLEERAHLPELAAGAGAGLGPRLRHHSRVDALEADGPLAEVLGAPRARVSHVSGRAGVAAR